ncbi:MAG TPA: OmpH family outer membrane protein [Terracidiphilus sp.]|jgi:outer membrane protein|nr:OmpH family outer membrane protein [Terracidiphilus sp.]
MKRSIWIALAMVTAFTVGLAAQTPSAPAPSAPARAGTSAATAPSSVGPAKIAVIAFQVAVSSTNEFQRSFLDLQKKFEPKRQALHALSDEIDALTKQLKATDSKLTDQEKAAKAKQLDDKQKQFDREQQEDQTDFSQEVQELFSGTASKVYDVLSAYAQQHGYTLVLDVASQQTPVMYAHDSTNLTKEVIAAYNTKSGVPPPPAGTPAPQVPKPAAKPAPKPPAQ